ncbi:MAG: hypothetical protein GY794_06265 [bacterium]|nr:hypothetical protein [bacterium]
MSGNTIMVLIIVVIGGGIAAAVAYYIVRFMRGSIKLSMVRTAFNPGDTITGSFDLVTKKAIQGNKLIVSLIGVKVTKTYEGDEQRTRSQEIYRNEVVIEEARQYPGGHTAKHEFEIPTPNTNTSDAKNSAMGQALTSALRLLGNKQTRIKWKVEARLDAKGVDLAASKSISLNVQPLI